VDDNDVADCLADALCLASPTVDNCTSLFGICIQFYW